jgi:hypothetical protein
VNKFWNKFKNKINHGFALTYNTLKKIMQMNRDHSTLLQFGDATVP